MKFDLNLSTALLDKQDWKCSIRCRLHLKPDESFVDFIDFDDSEEEESDSGEQADSAETSMENHETTAQHATHQETQVDEAVTLKAAFDHEVTSVEEKLKQAIYLANESGKNFVQLKTLYERQAEEHRAKSFFDAVVISELRERLTIADKVIQKLDVNNEFSGQISQSFAELDQQISVFKAKLATLKGFAFFFSDDTVSKEENKDATVQSALLEEDNTKQTTDAGVTFSESKEQKRSFDELKREQDASKDELSDESESRFDLHNTFMNRLSHLMHSNFEHLHTATLSENDADKVDE